MMLQFRQQGSRQYALMPCIVLVLFGLNCLAGCGGAAPVKLAGKPTDAVAVLNSTLKEWQEGKKVEDLKGKSPQTIVRDVDWESGAKLKDFEVKPDARQDGGNWRVEAVLTMEGQGVPTSPTLVAYSVTVESHIVSILRKDHLE